MSAPASILNSDAAAFSEWSNNIDTFNSLHVERSKIPVVDIINESRLFVIEKQSR